MPSDSELDPTFILVQCERCQTKLRVRSTLAGKTGACPKCQAPLPIPALPEYGDEDEREPTRKLGPGYRLAAELSHESDDDQPPPLPKELRAPIPEHGFLDRLAQVRQVAVSKPPKWIFFSGVFEFPWYADVWPRWIWMVLGGIAISVIPALALDVLNGSSGYSGLALAFFAMPQVWLTFWTGSYASSCGRQVFEDTAAGNDCVTGWPDPNWREWMEPFIHQSYVAFMILAIAYGITTSAGLSGRNQFLAIALTEYFLFPLCLLSVLEANRLAILISPAVLQTLFTKWTSWLTFYFLTAGMAVVWGGTMYYSISLSVMFGMLVNGFLFATLVLIYFRLLGRLAWSISHTRRKKRPKAKKARQS